MRTHSRRIHAKDIAVSMLVVFGIMRMTLTLNPTANFDVAGFNIHHLFTGILLLIGAAIPVFLNYGSGRSRRFLNVVFGVGLGLVLDEWVYLIATDGSDLAYLTPASFWGGLLMIGLASAAILLLARFSERP